MKKVIWRHPSAHQNNIWVESFEFNDNGRLYLAINKESKIRVYLDKNKGIIIK